jgi:bis(5'-nucleosyl)-tetraphosphatase (symmetrical)
MCGKFPRTDIAQNNPKTWRTRMATYLIGDIQGCYDPLQRLLDKIQFDPASDKLWCCGDAVNRGGQSLEVLRLLYSLRERLVFTLGNHDFYLLADNVRNPDGRTWNREFRAILRAHDRDDLLTWLQHLPLAFSSAEHNILMVHAGVVPQWTVQQTLTFAAEVQAALRSEQAVDFLLYMNTSKQKRWKDERTGIKRWSMITAILTQLRFCDVSGKALWSASGPPGSQPEEYQPWFRHAHRATRDVRMVFGHWAALGLRIKKRYIALDSGCVWGGRLSAFRLDDEHLFQVPGHFR